MMMKTRTVQIHLLLIITVTMTMTSGSTGRSRTRNTQGIAAENGPDLDTNPLWSCVCNCGDRDCEPKRTATDIRLVGGGKSNGRVEVFHNGVWGTVCDDSWNDRAATLVCQELGYTSGIARTNAFYGEGTDPTLLDNVNCSPQDTSLWKCSRSEWGVEDCSHSEDAGVDCS